MNKKFVSSKLFVYVYYWKVEILKFENHVAKWWCRLAEKIF